MYLKTVKWKYFIPVQRNKFTDPTVLQAFCLKLTEFLAKFFYSKLAEIEKMTFPVEMPPENPWVYPFQKTWCLPWKIYFVY